ncbi:hypothetical protein F8388_002125 [Cannabis sativa]|uniref:Uncharacterized protein n=1 Tax=Cannabis sativa TaxID=3483 RepID=A0A7J6EYR5_CANSA|nr:hypothetical protein F8388_002125 [Cannabis sativa]KAF4389850.1 hypothetical protein G4B88_024131 [Cannabis sativa]
MLVQDRVGPKSSKQTQIKSLPTHHHPGRLSEPKNLDFSTWVSENLYKVVHVFVLISTVGAVFFLRNVGDTAALLCFENHVEALEKIEFPKIMIKTLKIKIIINDLAFSYPHKQLCVVTCGEDRVIKVWDAATGAKQYTFEGHESIVYSVCPHYKENIQVIFFAFIIFAFVLSSTRKCLLDFVKEENLRKSAENCSSSHKQFESKVSQFKQMFNEIHRKMDEVFSSRASPPIRNLEQIIKDHHRFINEQKSIMQSLRLAFLFFSTIFLFVVFQLPFEISEVLQQKSAPFGNLLVSIGWYTGISQGVKQVFIRKTINGISIAFVLFSLTLEAYNIGSEKWWWGADYTLQNCSLPHILWHENFNMNFMLKSNISDNNFLLEKAEILKH